MSRSDIGLSPLQQRLYDELIDELCDPVEGFVREDDAKDLAANIKTMNAAELHRNLKVFKEADEVAR